MSKELILKDSSVLNKQYYWLIKAADKGNKEAQKELAESYLTGSNGLEKSQIKAEYWKKQYERAEEPKVKKVVKTVVVPANVTQVEIPANVAKPAKPVNELSEEILALVKSAESGIVDSEFLLAEKYASGNDVKKDDKKAFEWYLKAANHGLERAMVSVGISYKEGFGVEKNDELAFEWFERAADKEYLPAIFELGACYLEGVGATPNKRVAFMWLDKALEGGYTKAETYVGDCYLNGFGVLKDSLKAKELYEKAATKNSGYAQYKLGEMYASNGLSIVKDEVKACKWFEKAVVNGQPDAEYMLGHYYAFGHGGKKVNMEKAHDLFVKSAKKGNRFAIAALKKNFNEEVGA